jgi:hypothetical protein
MVGLLDHLNVCTPLLEQICSICMEERTSILDAVLCKYTIAPVRDTPYGLHTAIAMRGRSVGWFDFFSFIKVKALFETMTHSMPLLTMGVTCAPLAPNMITDNIYIRTTASFGETFTL